MTFTIIGIDKEKGELGIAGLTKVISFGAVGPIIDLNIGALCTQSFPNLSYKKNGLNLLKNNSSKETVNKLIKSDNDSSVRQVLVMDSKGDSFAFTGSKNVPFAGHKIGKDFVCAGNMLYSKKVISSMAKSFSLTKGSLAKRLIKSLEEGFNAGGDKRDNEFSSAFLIVKKEGFGVMGQGSDYINFRIDMSKNPISDLRALLFERKKLNSFFSKDFEVHKFLKDFWKIK